MTENQRLVQRVLGTIKVLKELDVYDVCARLETKGTYNGFFDVDIGPRAEESYYLDPVNGVVVHCTWEISYHNGDPYGFRSKLLDPLPAHQALVGLCALLEKMGIEAKRQQAKKAEEQERERSLRSAFEQRLQREGVR
jgi:hypothetical protein